MPFLNGFSHVAVISIHALRGEGDPTISITSPPFTISIHALRVEGDATPYIRRCAAQISIHALRVEGDYKV